MAKFSRKHYISIADATDTGIVSFTIDCSGDMGVKVDDRVVSHYFAHADRYHVYDLVLGGKPYIVKSLVEANNLMLAFGNREKRKVLRTCLAQYNHFLREYNRAIIDQVMGQNNEHVVSYWWQRVMGTM